MCVLIIIILFMFVTVCEFTPFDDCLEIAILCDYFYAFWQLVEATRIACHIENFGVVNCVYK